MYRVPALQLFLEDLLTQFAHDFRQLLVRITLRNEVDRRLPNQVEQGKVKAGRIGRVKPVQERLLGLDYDG